MRLPLLLLLCTPLAMGAYPPMLEGIERSMFETPDVPDVVDVVCGRKNFTAAFWNTMLVEYMADYLARDTIKRNTSLCDAACVEEIDETLHGREFGHLCQSLREAYKALDNAEAKSYIDRLNEYALKYRKMNLNPKNSQVAKEESSGKFSLLFPNFPEPSMSVESKVAYAQAMKRAFGYVETVEIRRFRIQTAMNAFNNTERGRDDEEIVALIGKLQELASGKAPFDHFAMYWMKYDQHAEWIRPVEIVPAIETLYLQYRAIPDQFTKQTVNNGLNALKAVYEGTLKRTPKERILTFDSVDDESMSDLSAAFPELFEYFDKQGYIPKEKSLQRSELNRVARRLRKEWKEGMAQAVPINHITNEQTTA